MLQMDFSFFNAESIRVFTSTFLGICSSTSYPFGFTSRIKRTPLEILKFLVTTLNNQYNKFAFILVDEYGALEKYYEFMNTCHDMNIIVQNIGVDLYSINGKNEINNNKLDHITRALLLNSSHKK